MEKNKVIDHICEQIEIVTLGRLKSTDVNPKDKLIEDIGIDSLDYASILLNCEDKLKIKVKEEGVDWRKIQTVDDLANFLNMQTNVN